MSIAAVLNNIKIFADGASLPSMLESARDPRIAGFTTNPTLMRKAGVTDYVAFAKEVLVAIRDKLKPMLAAGKSLDEVKAAKPTAAWDEKLGQGFMKPDVFLGIVYKSLSKK